MASAENGKCVEWKVRGIEDVRIGICGDSRPRLSAARSAALLFIAQREWGLVLQTDFSAILPIQQIPHRLPPRLVRFSQRLTLVGAHAFLFGRTIRLRLAACRTSVGKPRLPRLQFKFFRADYANFNRKCHPGYYFINHRQRLTTVSRKQLTCLWRQHREPYKINFS